VTTVTFSPNAHVIASASYDNTVRLWYPGSSIKTKILKGHTAAVKTVDFFRDGRTLLTGGDDKTLKLWDSESLKFKASFLGHNNWIRSAKAKADMTQICSGG
jgi:centriolar protein POC1